VRSYLNKILYSFSVLVLLFNININSAKADFAEVTEMLSTATCDTEGLHNLIMEPFTHSCIQDTFMSLVVSSVLSGGLHTLFMGRLRMDDHHILPGNCLRENRANPDNPTISFGLCANLFIADPGLGRAAIGKGMIAHRAEMLARVIGSAATGGDVKQYFRRMTDSSEYTVIYYDKHDGDWGSFIDTGLILPWKVEERGDRICVTTIGATILVGNWLAVGCKYIAEPFPDSVYASFFQNTGMDPEKVPPEMVEYLNCATAGGCSARAQVYSQATISISSTIIECIREMIIKMLISKDVCVIGNFDGVERISTADSSFYQFQRNMQRAVMAFLTLYIMSVGFKILMGGAQKMPQSSELIMYILKFMLVVYFSVGMNITPGGQRFDGMISFVFPILLNAAAEISTWVANAAPSGLCRFLPTDYPDGLGHLALWDAIDCKVVNYLGIDALLTMWKDTGSPDPLGYNIPPYAYLIVPALYSKQINLVILCITYPLLVLSLAAYLVNAFAVCLIAIAILGILAPLFVPMALFEFTKRYFQSWYTLMISFVLQPVVVIGFMTLMFSLYDFGFYGTCKYIPLEVKKTVNTGDVVTKKLFIIDNEMGHYESEKEYKACTESIGWVLNNPLAATAARLASLSPDGRTIDMSAAPEAEKKMADYIKQFGALSGVTPAAGFFLGYFALAANLSWTMIVNLFICCLLIYLMYELSSQLGEFAADIAQSVTLSGTIGPRTVVDKATDALQKLGKQAKGEDKEDPSMGKGEGEKNPSMGKRGGTGSPSMGKKDSSSSPSMGKSNSSAPSMGNGGS